MRQRKTPIRTCVACRTSGEKRSLVRIVRTATGEVVIDSSGKLPGRGAYLCPAHECLRQALKQRRLARALKAEISEETVRKLEDIMKQGSDDM